MKRLLVGVAALSLVATAAIGQGLFPNFPIVGGASYCAAYTTGVNGQVCSNTVPAGPSALTGNEKIPADTYRAQGAQPQTVLIPMQALGAGPTALISVGTGTVTGTVPAGASKVIIKSTGAVTSMTLTLPTPTVDGQTLEIGANQTLTAFALTPTSGITVDHSPTALTASATAPYGYKLVYVAADSKWYRLQ